MLLLYDLHGLKFKPNRPVPHGGDLFGGNKSAVILWELNRWVIKFGIYSRWVAFTECTDR